MSKSAGAHALTSFTFKSTDVRTIEKDGLIWFVASDIAKSLNYADATHMTRVLDDDEKGLHIVETPSGKQEVTIINESGLYHALLKSRKPEAQPFRKWVTSEVLPTIRKTGGYGQPAAEPAALLPNHHHITPAQAEEIATLMCVLFPASLDRHAAWARFKANFKIHSYRRLPASKFAEAITFIESTDARRRNEFGREAEGRQGSYPVLHGAGPQQIDLAALARQVAGYLADGRGGETPDAGHRVLEEVGERLQETLERFNQMPNSVIFQNLSAIMQLIKKGLRGGQGARRDAPTDGAAAKLAAQSDLVNFMRESDMLCIEIGLHEIEAAAGCDAGLIRAGDLAGITAKALRKRPEHLADIHLVSGWMFAEAHCTEAGREGVRQHWLGVAQDIEENAISA